MSVDSDYLVVAVYQAASVVGNTSVPFESFIASKWQYMTDNYSKLTIATVFSVILHEVRVYCSDSVLMSHAFSEHGHIKLDYVYA